MPGAARRTPVPDDGRLPVRFEPNLGQAPAQVQYLARGAGYSMALTHEGMTLALRHGARAGAGAAPARPVARLRLRLVHGRSGAALRAGQQQASLSNYFIGRDPSRWRTHVPNYARPAAAISLAAPPPRATAVMARRRSPWTLRAMPTSRATRARATFALGDYDHSRELIIDPVLAYATYLGGSGFDQAATIATDAQGNAYIAGNTGSADLPLEQPLQGSDLEHAFDTAFIAK